MGKNSAIAWTDHTFNPWWGCQKVSTGCKNCYAEAFAVGRQGLDIWGPAATTKRRVFGNEHFEELLTWNRAAEKAGRIESVFVASMADVFEDHPMVEPEREVLWTTMEFCSSLRFLLLTKRPENITPMLPNRWWFDKPPRLWFGISAENQDMLDARWGALEGQTRHLADGLFLSLEPLPGNIDLEHCLEWTENSEHKQKWGRGADWVIVGGESGFNARPMNLGWARAIRDQCVDNEIPFFFKQVGGKDKEKGGDVLDGQVWHQFPWKITDPQDATVQLEMF